MGKKKGKKAKKLLQQKIENMAPAHIIAKANKAMAAGKYRDAINLFKIAGKKLKDINEIKPLLFKAYVLREKELRKKGMKVEADSIREIAKKHMPPVSSMAESDFVIYLNSCKDKKAFESYDRYLLKNGRVKDAETLLVNRVLASQKWELLENFREDFPLKEDADIIQTALPLMNEGKWEDALPILRSVPRGSLYAPVRLFCHTMVCFYAQKYRDMVRSAHMIPDDFILKNVAVTLEINGKEHDIFKIPEGKKAIVNSLWNVPSYTALEDIKRLISSISPFNKAGIKENVSKVAEAIYPQDPVTAKSYILELLFTPILNSAGKNPLPFFDIARSVLDYKTADIVIAKTKSFTSDNPVEDSVDYLKLIKNDFSEQSERELAHSAILYNVLKQVNHKRINIAKRLSKGTKSKEIKKFFGINSSEKDMICIDIAVKGISLDPVNKKWYVLLAELPRSSREVKKAVEPPLLSMLETFHDDPYPCLELANLYYEKNAFRKAEKILEEAIKRAPHDNRVINKHALSLLISADKNFKMKRFHLVHPDIEKAEKLESKKQADFILARQMCYRILHQHDVGGNIKKLFKEDLDKLSTFQSLRITSLILLDLIKKEFQGKKKLEKDILSLFKTCLKKSGELSSSEIFNLLSPLDKEYLPLFSSQNLAPVFVQNYPAILKKLNNEDFTGLIELITEPALNTQLISETKKRVSIAESEDRLFLEFYLATLKHLENKKKKPDMFNDIIDQVDEKMMEKFRAASRRLAKHAKGPLKTALEMFDFSYLENGSFPFLSDDDFDDDDDDYDDNNFFPDFSGPMPPGVQEQDVDEFTKMIAMLPKHMIDQMVDKKTIREMKSVVKDFENLIDHAGLRGAPKGPLEEFANIFKNTGDDGIKALVMATTILKKKEFRSLSREGEYILKKLSKK